MSLPERNDPCPCGSGKKYKKCCLGKAAPDMTGLRRNQAEAYHKLGMANLKQGEPARAMECFQQALKMQPDYAEAQYNLGIVLMDRGRYDEALACLNKVLELKPDMAEAHFDLGNIFSARRRPEDAIASYRRALLLKPDLTEAHYNLGTLLLGLERLEEAEQCFRAAMRIRPDLAEAHYNLGYVLNKQRRYQEAINCFRAALTFRPDSADVFHSLGNALLKLGRGEEAVECLDRAIALDPSAARIFNSRLLALHYLYPPAMEKLWTAHCRYGERFETPLKPRWPRHANARDPVRRLKVGYVSPDLRRHSVAYFLEPILSHHDKREVEVHVYYNYRLRDAVTAHLMPYADRWLDCKALTDEQLAARIMEDGIDILVDLAGHTRGNRLLTFARKPAPVQVSYLGYPATTGLSAMDYRLVTWDTDPAGAERWHTERLYRLPRSLWCYRPEAGLPAVAAETPARRSGTITFGSMNNLAKVSEATVATWSGLLKRVPGSRLVMTNIAPAAAAGVRERFARHGVEGERLRLEGRLETPAYRALLSQVDIALDPYPYNGTTTTCEVLWMGIPVVTLTGETSVARSGYALLKLIGLTELAAPDETGYVAIAAGLATDLDRLETLRRGLRARMEASPLRDEAGLTRDIEAAYRAMWKGWCAQGATA